MLWEEGTSPDLGKPAGLAPACTDTGLCHPARPPGATGMSSRAVQNRHGWLLQTDASPFLEVPDAGELIARLGLVVT